MISDSQKKAVRNYLDKQDDIRFRVPKGEREIYKQHAEKMGESLAGFLKRAAKETMYRDNEETEKYGRSISLL